MESGERAYLPIERSDLERLAAIAEADRNDLFARRPHLAPLAELFLCTALCQGAALHFVDGRNGIKDFDVWTFYRADAKHVFPPRRVVDHDLGYRKFGLSANRDNYIGRRVDLIGRSIPCVPDDTPVTALRRWFISGGRSPGFLSEKAVVLLAPANYLGFVVWPHGAV
jgi:hypothetical protein